jgi:uncharacterized membrane protein
MKNYTLTPKKLALTLSLSLGTTIGAIALFGQSTLAQSVNSPDPAPYQSNEENSLGGSLGGGSFNAFELIHRANMSRGRSMGEFQQDTESGIRNAAEEFKRQRGEQLQNQQPPNTLPNSTPEN